MAAPGYRQLAINGLWADNPALVRLLGLCPLLAVTTSVANAFGLGVATLLVLVLSTTAVSLLRNSIADSIRLFASVMIIAASVTGIELLMQAYTYELHQALGIFLPLIVSNCIILNRAEDFASKNPAHLAAWDGLLTGLGFAAVLLVLGALRELLGTGALFANMDWLFGSVAVTWKIQVFKQHQEFLVAILPPGAFLITGLLIAAHNLIEQRVQARQKHDSEPVMAGSRRVRVTGKIS